MKDHLALGFSLSQVMSYSMTCAIALVGAGRQRVASKPAHVGSKPLSLQYACQRLETMYAPRPKQDTVSPLAMSRAAKRPRPID